MRKIDVFRPVLIGLFVLNAVLAAAAQTEDAKPDTTGKAEAVLQAAIRSLGGDRYLQVKTQIGRGKFSVLRDGGVISFQTFTDIIVFPDKERTEFKSSGVRTIQANSGDTGWVYDGAQDLVRQQNATQLAGFKQAIRASLDNLLRGNWRGQAEIAYVGKRPSTLGKRNEVIKLTYNDGFSVEFEFAADNGLPQKALYKRKGADGEETKEEDRYALFVEFDGIKTPFVVDRFSDDKPAYRINYELVEFNKAVPDSIFAKPASPKEAKKGIGF